MCVCGSADVSVNSLSYLLFYFLPQFMMSEAMAGRRRLFKNFITVVMPIAQAIILYSLTTCVTVIIAVILSRPDFLCRIFT